MESAGNSNQRNGWTDPGMKWTTGPGPGQGTRGKETMGHYGSGRDRERTKPGVFKGVYWGADAESALPGKGRLG